MVGTGTATNGKRSRFLVDDSGGKLAQVNGETEFELAHRAAVSVAATGGQEGNVVGASQFDLAHVSPKVTGLMLLIIAYSGGDIILIGDGHGSREGRGLVGAPTPCGSEECVLVIGEADGGIRGPVVLGGSKGGAEGGIAHGGDLGS